MRLERSYVTCDQMEHESVSVYMYRWGQALYRSSGIRHSEERHLHVIEDFHLVIKEAH